MALPTMIDIVFSNIVADRILLRRNFESLRDRAGSKYFKHIVIKDVEWDKTIPELPTNFPLKFVEQFPYDFRVEYTVLGCNAIKCYKHNYSEPCRGKDPFLINGYVLACSEACYDVFDEFNQFLAEKFQLENINHHTRNVELPLETMSIADDNGLGDNRNFCGVQMTDLKKFALLPSSRWVDMDRVKVEGKPHLHQQQQKRRSVHEYIDEYRDNPMRLCDMSGLVDTPPLTWIVENQDVGFNPSYCRRFVKEYDEESDECYDRAHRKVLGWVFGDNLVRMFPDSDFNGPLPIDYLIRQMFFDGFHVNPGYIEQALSQGQVERKFYTSAPDKMLGPGDTVTVVHPMSSTPFSVQEVAEKGQELSNIVEEIIRGIATDVGVEIAVTQSPLVISRLMKHFASKFLDKVLTGAGNLLPLSTRLSSLVIRSLITDVCIKTAIRFLALASSVATAVFAVSVITVIPDFLISYYNLYGFNNEITKNHIKARKKIHVDEMLKYFVESHRTSLSYINVINREKSEHYTSPLITPEYIYQLCLLNFIEENPSQKINIGITGINPEEHLKVSMFYLQSLSVNSAGQYISYDEEERMKMTTTSTTANTYTSTTDSYKAKREKGYTNYDNNSNNNGNNNNNHTLRSNSDILLLTLGTFFLILSIVFGYIYNRINIFMASMIISCVCFVVWFICIKPQILRTKKEINPFSIFAG